MVGTPAALEPPTLDILKQLGQIYPIVIAGRGNRVDQPEPLPSVDQDVFERQIAMGEIRGETDPDIRQPRSDEVSGGPV